MFYMIADDKQKETGGGFDISCKHKLFTFLFYTEVVKI
jgi:hypothetical protein